MEENKQSLKDLICTRLENSRQIEELGLIHDINPLDRLLSIEGQDGGFLVTLSSKGLAVNHKLALESYLIENTDNYGSILIYFKNIAAESFIAKRAPAPFLGNKSAPFGVKLRKQAIPGVSKVIAVSSGKGGVGKSTVSTNLAVSLAKLGLKVGLLDADIYGPSAPLMLGLKGPMPVVGGNRIKPLVGHGVKCVSFGFMTDEKNPVIWRGPMVAKALEQLFYQTEWESLDYLIIDLPPGTGDVQMTMIERLPLHGAIIVSTPQSVALLDAHKGLSMFQKLNVPVLGVVENMSFHLCPKCGYEDHIFGNQMEEFARSRELPIIGRIPLRGEIREACDAGQPVAAGEGEISRYYRDLAMVVTKEAIQ